jgi:hippocalcin-like protein 1
MVGPHLALHDPLDTPERRTKEIFVKMDENQDGVLSKEEFVRGCLADRFLYLMLTADSGGGDY